MSALERAIEKRKLYHLSNAEMSEDSAAPDAIEAVPRPVEHIEHATLVGSKARMDFGANTHFPVIDIDFPVHVVESSPGKNHLYIEKAISWDRYVILLQALVQAGIVEPGYFEASLRRGQTHVRKPGFTKTSQG